jgi:hypothetical protein
MIGSLLYLTSTQPNDWLPPVPHGDTAGHSIRHVPMCVLSGFPTLFTPDNSSADFQVSQTHIRVWDLVFWFFLARSYWVF